MNAVEIEEAVSSLAVEPFNSGEFPYEFLKAFGNKDTTVKRLRAGASNASDVGGVLQRNNIHIAVAETGQVRSMLTALRQSPATTKGKAKFILATDGSELEAEELATGEIVSCAYTELANHFGFFLPLAGISTVAQIKNNPIDIKATSRLNKLYVELLKENLDWGSAERRQELNQFMARLIFCFFAEDTGIFQSQGLFSTCVQQMSDGQTGNTHEVIKELFRAMDTKPEDRAAKAIKSWANAFPYVNGGLFTHHVDCPRFSRTARSYLLRASELNWKEINPDIFGSMIQAVADDDERGELGMHYTSVPNILKVLDPLFLDDLREQLEQAEDNPRKLLNLRKRISSIRVFDPACGSGNFLVIAYIKMREIEADIIRRRGEQGDAKAQKSWIPLTNFYGIEIKSFAAEVARLSLLIAEFQCNVRLIGQREACLDVLPLHDTGRVHTGNALRMHWMEVCPPPSEQSAIEQDLAGATGRLALEPPQQQYETYICGNPPYLGSSWQEQEHKEDLEKVFSKVTTTWKSLDYVSGWFMKAAQYSAAQNALVAFVSTNSIAQGQQVAGLWPLLFNAGVRILFAYSSFKWNNLATNNAGVTVVIVGFGPDNGQKKQLFESSVSGELTFREVPHLNAYLVAGSDVPVIKTARPISEIPPMERGNGPVDGGGLILDEAERNTFEFDALAKQGIVRKFVGSHELINGYSRYCLWLMDDQAEIAINIPAISNRLQRVAEFRKSSPKAPTKAMAKFPHRFAERRQVSFGPPLIIPKVSSEHRPYLPIAYMPAETVVSDNAFAFYDAPLWSMALVGSRLHLVWIATVCGKMKTDFRYSNTLGWNTFPVPPLTDNQKADLTRCAENILLAREAHFPATIADLYDPETMPENLRQAHDRNDETLERIYIGRRFKNDTERLEKLFDMYTKMTKDEKPKKGKKAP